MKILIRENGKSNWVNANPFSLQNPTAKERTGYIRFQQSVMTAQSDPALSISVNKFSLFFIKQTNKLLPDDKLLTK